MKVNATSPKRSVDLRDAVQRLACTAQDDGDRVVLMALYCAFIDGGTVTVDVAGWPAARTFVLGPAPEA